MLQKISTLDFPSLRSVMPLPKSYQIIALHSANVHHKLLTQILCSYCSVLLRVSDFVRATACLGLLAVHNFYTPFLFFLRKTALRQVAHRDVTRPHYVRSSHLPKSAKSACAIKDCFAPSLRSVATALS